MSSTPELVRQGVLEAARLMAISAVTAPKAKGVDNLVVRVLEGREELERLASRMEELAGELGEFFARDAQSVRGSDAVLLVGARIVGFKLKRPKGFPVDVDVFMSLMNLGIAVGSAVKTASLLNVDNRVMYSAGVAAVDLGMIDADVALAIPLSAKAKNIYFDRRPRTP